MAVKSVSTRFSDTLFSLMRNIKYLKHGAEQLSTISFWFLTSKQYQQALTAIGDRKEFASPPIYRLNSGTSGSLRASCELWVLLPPHKENVTVN